jgi:hypothetical protein
MKNFRPFVPIKSLPGQWDKKGSHPGETDAKQHFPEGMNIDPGVHPTLIISWKHTPGLNIFIM